MMRKMTGSTIKREHEEEDKWQQIRQRTIDELNGANPFVSVLLEMEEGEKKKNKKIKCGMVQRAFSSF